MAPKEVILSKIRISNWLLTRKCNLNCDYCAIVKNYSFKPAIYPDMSHYMKKEMSTHRVINGLKLMKKHNPNMFHIFYGGEPLLRKDLSDIINFCNKENIFYTVISNNTPRIQPLIKQLFNKVEYVEGFTSSVDPIFNEVGINEDRVRKSIEGLKQLKEIQASGKVKDVVAEITVMNHNIHLLHKLVKELSEHDIYSDITFVDIAKSRFYDFSNVRDTSSLVYPTKKVYDLFQDLMEDNSLLIHMKDVLLPTMFDTLPSTLDCKIEKNLHNISIDADGTIRLCLRIRGASVPMYHNLETLFNEDGSVNKEVKKNIAFDKKHLCKLCNHSCLIMSQYIDETEDGEDDLVHMDKRGQ
jgi:MoaA/NifB/PqqE/SkfB family radical SAM enzyme